MQLGRISVTSPGNPTHPNARSGSEDSWVGFPAQVPVIRPTRVEQGK